MQIAATRRPFYRRLRKYWEIFRTQLANNFAYPLDLLSRSIMIVIFMWIFAQLWRTTYSKQGLEVIAGLSIKDTMWYLMLAETLVLSRPRVAQPISQQVKDGSIAYMLSKPYDFILYQFCVGIGDTILQIISNLIAGGVVVWYLVGPPPSYNGWHYVLITMVLATIINFCIDALIGLLAFITEDIEAFQWIYGKFVLILGGVLIPLDFLPEWLQQIAAILPFSPMVYGPARLFISPNTAVFINLLLLQAFWISLFTIMLMVFYRKIVSRLAINGG